MHKGKIMRPLQKSKINKGRSRSLMHQIVQMPLKSFLKVWFENFKNNAMDKNV